MTEIPKNKETGRGSRKILWVIFSCLFLLIIAAWIVVYGAYKAILFGAKNQTQLSSDSYPISGYSPTPTQTSKTYPKPKACEQVKTPGAQPLSIDASNPGFKADTDTYYYAIYAYTLVDLITQLRTCGPKIDGKPYDGLTNYNLNWRYQYYDSGGSCRIQKAVVGLKIDLYYPKWQAQGDIQPGLQEKWNKYIAALEVHEQGHVKLETEAGQKIYNFLIGLPAYSSCGELDSVANGGAYNIYNSYEVAQKDYDDQTQHGITQGTALE